MKISTRIVACACLVLLFLAGCGLTPHEIEKIKAKAIEEERINAERALTRERSKKAKEEQKAKEIEEAKAYDEKLGYITGEVIEELTDASGYYIGIKTENGQTFGVRVIDSEDKKATALALSMIIEKGTKIGFPAGNLKSADSWPVQYYNEETCFGEGMQTGLKRADRIRVY